MPLRFARFACQALLNFRAGNKETSSGERGSEKERVLMLKSNARASYSKAEHVQATGSQIERSQTERPVSGLGPNCSASTRGRHSGFGGGVCLPP